MSQNQFWQLLAKKLSGEASRDEIMELQELMKANPEHLYAAQHIADLWKLEAGENIIESAEAFELHMARMKEMGIDPEAANPENSESDPHLPFRKTWKIKLYFLSSICILFTATILYLGIYRSTKHQPAISASRGSGNISEISTRPGSKTKLILPDSSVVWLNSGSRMTYDEHFGVNGREVTLSGEAYFDVKKSHLPFIIHAHSIQIKVLGTAFNVKSYPSDKTTETSLIRGKVEITFDKRPEEKYILKPNEKLVVSNEQDEYSRQPSSQQSPLVMKINLAHTTDNVIAETSWVDNKLIFNNETFRDLALRMELWYGVKIAFKNAEVAAFRLTGVFEKETVQQALEALQMSSAFHYMINNNLITITK